MSTSVMWPTQVIARPDGKKFFDGRTPLPWIWANEIATKIPPGEDWFVQLNKDSTAWEARARFKPAPHEFENWQEAFLWVGKQFGITLSSID